MAADAKFVVIEMHNGVIDTRSWTYEAKADAEVKYYQVLSETVKSPIECHTVMLCTSEAFVIDSKTYRHAVEADAEDTETATEE